MAEHSHGFDAFLAARSGSGLPEDVATASTVVCLAGPGVPVLYVSPAFEAHTGYSPEEAVGRSLSFLRGPETEPEAVARFDALIAGCEAGTVRITNYRRDGTPFRHVCELRPIRDATGTVTHFVAVQRPEQARPPA